MIDDNPSNLLNQQPMHEYLNQFCELISSLKLTPNKLIQNLLTNGNINYEEVRKMGD
ncbi:hypothetical protein CROQUDRAFT_685160 [Cronartium quercuum f. sp. fusiforme G11]|uniref:Uncharacterized protein n=1 Tax=Cronartium quercuum f. sp. fusiforme G11 TaxID=708437 RepID=A0A9P6T714_9BASI|nr:hypothetical protein CROQUDRAFT_685160 [Cronartium quercuum f. sp. fusiforme G11]